MKQAQISAAARYVRAIPNPKKREYAAAYFNFRRGTIAEPEPPADLSYNAAQTVRMRIDEMLKSP